MNALMVALMTWLSAQTGLPSAPVPRVVFEDGCTIQRTFTQDPDYQCETIHIIAIYDHRVSTVFLRNTWAPDDLYDVSVLLHELVHHMQAASGKNVQNVDCPGRDIEKPAYDAQIAWLEAAGVNPWKTMSINALGLSFITSCERHH